jgi:hypothetical protein
VSVVGWTVVFLLTSLFAWSQARLRLQYRYAKLRGKAEQRAEIFRERERAEGERDRKNEEKS